MRHSLQQATIILDRARNVLEEARPDDFKLQHLWVTLAYIHGMALAQRLKARLGTAVQAGPFKGMKLTENAMAGSFAPYLLGTYEHELHPFIEDAVAAHYPQIVNIGCAFGYYSVGLALRMPEAAVYAFDTSESCQQRCREMAELNGVASRLRIAGEFKGEDFATFAAKKTLAIVDIETAEVDLLDPARYPALAKIDIIVELHDVFSPSISRTIMKRFEATHDIALVRNRAQLFDFAPLVGEDTYVDPFDSLIVTWENRDGPTPWAVMKSRAPP